MKLEIETKVIDAVDEVVEVIRSMPATSVALVIGHSDTAPETIDQLGGPSLPILASTEFDHLFVPFSQRTAHLWYGA